MSRAQRLATGAWVARWRWPVLALLGVHLVGCGSDDPGSPPPAQDEITALPFPTTVQLAAADLASMQPDPGDGTLTFTAPPAALLNVGVGSILVAGVGPSTPAGLLRAVLSVDRSGGNLVLRTGQAPIQLAYKKLHLKLTRSAAVAGGGAARSPLSPRSRRWERASIRRSPSRTSSSTGTATGRPPTTSWSPTARSAVASTSRSRSTSTGAGSTSFPTSS